MTITRCQLTALATSLAVFSSIAASQTYSAPSAAALGAFDETNCSIRWTSTLSRGEPVGIQRVFLCPDGDARPTSRFVQVSYRGQILFAKLDDLTLPTDLLAQLEGASPENHTQIASQYFADATRRAAESRAQAEAEAKSKLARVELEKRERLETESIARIAKEEAQRKLDTAQVKKRLADSPIAILKFRPYDVSEHTEGTGISIVIANLSKKTIKYVSFRYVGLNAVNDPVADLKGPAVRGFKGIGPIASYETGAYERSYVWMTDIVQSVRLIAVEIEYMDGTKSAVSKTDRLWITDTELDLLERSR